MTLFLPRSRSPQHVQQRLDHLIEKIYTIQEPFMQTGGAADILLVIQTLHFLAVDNLPNTLTSAQGRSRSYSTRIH